MAWESSTARCQVAIFYNTQIQWLDLSAIIKKVLCAFNNPGKERIKQIFQELQHQRWVGGADSTNGWLTQLWDDTVTAILFAEGTIRDGHEITAGFRGHVLKGANILIFFEEYYTSVPHIHLTRRGVRIETVLSSIIWCTWYMLQM